MRTHWVMYIPTSINDLKSASSDKAGEGVLDSLGLSVVPVGQELHLIVSECPVWFILQRSDHTVENLVEVELQQLWLLVVEVLVNRLQKLCVVRVGNDVD